jgi:hypothetical protein
MKWFRRLFGIHSKSYKQINEAIIDKRADKLIIGRTQFARLVKDDWFYSAPPTKETFGLLFDRYVDIQLSDESKIIISSGKEKFFIQ